MHCLVFANSFGLTLSTPPNSFLDSSRRPVFRGVFWLAAAAIVRRSSAEGGVAQLGERLNGIQEVSGSIPLASIASVRTVVSVAGIAQLVEHNLAKVGVAGSSPVSRLGAED